MPCTIVDRVVFIAKMKVWLSGRLGEMLICPECLEDVLLELDEMIEQEISTGAVSSIRDYILTDPRLKKALGLD